MIDTLTNELTQAKKRIRELTTELEKKSSVGGGRHGQQVKSSSGVEQHQLHQYDAILKTQPVASESSEEGEDDDEIAKPAALPKPTQEPPPPLLLHQQQPTTLHVDVASVDSTQNLEVSTTFGSPIVVATEESVTMTTTTENDNHSYLSSIGNGAVPSSSSLYIQLQITPAAAAVAVEEEEGNEEEALKSDATATDLVEEDNNDEEEEYSVNQSIETTTDELSMISDETAAMRKRVEDARARFAQIESFGALPPPLPRQPFGGAELSPACRITMAARAATPRGATS